MSLLQQNILARFIALRMAMACAAEMLAVAIGWHVYAQTGSAWCLAVVGLVQFLPSISLVLITVCLAWTIVVPVHGEFLLG
jgi:hypothetical protein